MGGKTAGLSRLAEAHRVPPGFCLTAHAPEPSSSQAARLAIGAAYGELARRAGIETPAVAVRSSGVDEDGAGASFAGQHETYLNVVGAEAVIDAIGRCRRSASSERARAYRRSLGLAGPASVAVLVQLLVFADVAAVVFSIDPRSGADDVVINASWGLGESIVGGTVTPDLYTVERRTMRVKERVLGDKTRMTVRTAGGTREVAVPTVLRDRHTLGDDAVLAAARLALSLESETGAPVDLECAFYGSELYLLQCRPVTTSGRAHAP